MRLIPNHLVCLSAPCLSVIKSVVFWIALSVIIRFNIIIKSVYQSNAVPFYAINCARFSSMLS